MLDSNIKKRVRSAVTASTGTTGMGLLATLREYLKAQAEANALLALEGTEIRFDTIQRVAHEETRKAYIALLDDPLALDALKKELLA